MASSSLEDQSDEMIVSSQFCPKARKTYTIKKQREKWTQQEHDKFVEALKLHGRAWRHIEEHIGTKTAVQIRSHAQKFFSKVVRDSTDATSSAVTIEIPPPRPKRKPAHPYPRKTTTTTTTTTTIPTLIRTGRKTVMIMDPKRAASPTLSVSEQEHQSPTSVLSGPANSSSPSPFSSHNTSLSVFESELSPKPKGSQTRSLKLFGTTVLVEISSTDPPMTEKEEVFISNPSCSIGSDLDQVYYILIPNEDSNQIEPLYPPLFPIHRPVASRKSPTCLTSTSSSCSGGSVGNINGENDLSKEVESESSGMLLKKNIGRSFSSEKRRRNCCKLEEKGFVPYKRCLISSVRDEQSSDSVDGRIRLCL